MGYPFKIIFLLLITSLIIYPQNVINTSSYSSEVFKKLNDSNYLLTADTSYNFNETVGWKYENATNLTYNSLGLLAEKTSTEFWNGLYWLNSSKDFYTYNENNRLQTVLYQVGQGESWVNDGEKEYVYAPDGKNLSVYSYRWTDSSWENLSRITYNYDSNRNLVSSMGEGWINGSWINGSLDSFYYNSYGLVSECIYKSWRDTLWENFSKYLYSYDFIQREIESINYSWRNNKWEVSDRTLKTYHNITPLISVQEIQTFRNSNWFSIYKDLYYYNTDDLLIEKIYQSAGINEWINKDRELHEYDSNQNEILLTHQTWSDNWQTVSKKESFYQLLTKVNQGKIHVERFQLSQNFPNPFNPITTIKYQIPEFNFVRVEVYDVIGNLITTLVNEEKYPGNYEVNFNAVGIPSGVYFYTLQSGTFLQTKKMILLK